MKFGCFIGDFDPSVYRTRDVEVAVKYHQQGDFWAPHYHPLATEINVLLHGQMSVNGAHFSPGDIFVIEPGEVARPVFYRNCQLVVVKIPGIRGDKVVVA